jgi:LCP family protein required for cell wall assembly
MSSDPRRTRLPEDARRYHAAPRIRGRNADPQTLLRELREHRSRQRRGGRLTTISFGRILRWLVIALVAWVGVSVVLFLISAQIRQGEVSGNVSRVLGHPGFPLVDSQTILVLGSDRRTAGNAEPGASTTGPSRSDSIMLMRVGLGKTQRLSIPRDAIADIPGHGRDKINAAFAIGGAPLAIQTVEQYLDIEVDHVVEVDFANFPELIDAMGGIDYEGGCVISKINGGFKNGGYTLRLGNGRTRIDGKQALALARTRKNQCNPAESDLTRARRQQKIFSAMKSRLLSPGAFIRLPWIAWNAPKALRTDMSGPTLLGLFGAISTGGSPPTQVLRPDGSETLPNGGAGLVVSRETRREAARKLLDG